MKATDTERELEIVDVDALYVYDRNTGESLGFMLAAAGGWAAYAFASNVTLHPDAKACAALAFGNVTA